MVNEYITIDLSEIRPFNCLYYISPNYLSISNCLGYCSLRDDYCQGQECRMYHKKGEL